MILLRRTQGTSRRVCGLQCHCAKGTICRCLCEGWFHGVTVAGLSARIHGMSSDHMQRYQNAGLDVSELHAQRQLSLPF